MRAQINNKCDKFNLCKYKDILPTRDWFLAHNTASILKADKILLSTCVYLDVAKICTVAIFVSFTHFVRLGYIIMSLKAYVNEIFTLS